MARDLATAGYDAVYLKCGDGGQPWPAQWNQDVLATFRGEGLTVCAWSYIYGDQPEREADLVAWAAAVSDTPHILDAEYEYIGKQAAAETFASRLGGWPKDRLAYAPDFRIAARNNWYATRQIPFDAGNWPWETFNRICGMVAPQLYISTFAWSYATAMALVDAWTARFPGIPVLPIFQRILDNGQPDPSADACEAAARAQGYPSVSFWRWA